VPDASRARRRYESPLREAAAAATHQRILEAAADLFGAQGYRPTTIAGIAERAGVSVPRVNLAGAKAQLLVAAYRQRVGGDPDMQHATDQPTLREIMALPAEEALAGYAGWLHRTHVRSAGLWFALRTAAENDPEAAALLAEIRARNDEDYLVAVAWADGLGLVSGDADASYRAEAWGLLGCAETYHRLVEQCGWSAERYVAWVVGAVRTTVLDLDA